jgi:hypothetical protein
VAEVKVRKTPSLRRSLKLFECQKKREFYPLFIPLLSVSYPLFIHSVVGWFFGPARRGLSLLNLPYVPTVAPAAHLFVTPGSGVHTSTSPFFREYRATSSPRQQLLFNPSFAQTASNAFCGECSRVRLTSDGKIRTCLFSQVDHDL